MRDIKLYIQYNIVVNVLNKQDTIETMYTRLSIRRYRNIHFSFKLIVVLRSYSLCRTVILYLHKTIRPRMQSNSLLYEHFFLYIYIIYTIKYLHNLLL